MEILAEKKILQLGKYYPPEWGGIEQVTKDIHRYFGRILTITTLVFTSGSNSSERDSGALIIRNSSKMNISRQPVSLNYMKYYVKNSRDFDLIYLHYPNIIAMFLVLLIKPKLLVVHWHSDLVGFNFLGLLMRPFEKILLQRSVRVVVTSQVYAEHSAVLRKFLDKVDVIPIAAAPKTASLTSTDTFEQLRNIPIGEKKLCLTVGRLVGYKGLHKLIDAFSETDDQHILVIAGQGPLKQELQKKIVKNKLTNRVFILGKVEENLLQYLFKSAECFILASNQRSEAFGVVLIEALSYSLPIIVHNNVGSGMTTIVEDTKNGFLVNLNKPETLNSALKSLDNDNELLRLRKNAYDAYIRHYHDDTISKKYTQLFYKIWKVT